MSGRGILLRYMECYVLLIHLVVRINVVWGVFHMKYVCHGVFLGKKKLTLGKGFL